MRKHLLRAALVACLVACSPVFSGLWFLLWAALSGAVVAWEDWRYEQFKSLLVRVRILRVRNELFDMHDVSNTEKALALASLDVAIKEVDR